MLLVLVVEAVLPGAVVSEPFVTVWLALEVRGAVVTAVWVEEGRVECQCV